MQSLVAAKVWNWEGIGSHAPSATKHWGHHYLQEGWLYELYVQRIWLPFYNGLTNRKGYIRLYEMHTLDRKDLYGSMGNKKQGKGKHPQTTKNYKYFKAINHSQKDEVQMHWGNKAKKIDQKVDSETFQVVTWLVVKIHPIQEVHHQPAKIERWKISMWNACKLQSWEDPVRWIEKQKRRVYKRHTR